VVKPLIAFHRHARSKDGHCHHCVDCAKAHRRRAQRVSF
jgi:hypothetical protein